MVHPREDLVRREDVDAGRGQLEGEGQAVEPPADGRDGRRIGVRVSAKSARAARARSTNRSTQSLPTRVGGRRMAGFVGHGEGRHRVDAFAGDRERLAAGREDRQAGRRREQRGDVGRGSDHLLEVVEDDERRRGRRAASRVRRAGRPRPLRARRASGRRWSARAPGRARRRARRTRRRRGTGRGRCGRPRSRVASCRFRRVRSASADASRRAARPRSPAPRTCRRTA